MYNNIKIKEKVNKLFYLKRIQKKTKKSIYKENKYIN